MLSMPPVPLGRLEGLELTSQECEQLMPQSALDLEARVQQLTEELGRVEESIVEAEAKSELYKLLEARTRFVGPGWVLLCPGAAASGCRCCRETLWSGPGARQRCQPQLGCRVASGSLQLRICPLLVQGTACKSCGEPFFPPRRRDHQASEQLQRESRQLKEDATDDFTTLTKHMHEMRAAKEDAERELAAAVGVLDQVRSDWRRKLADRRKEVGGAWHSGGGGAEWRGLNLGSGASWRAWPGLGLLLSLLAGLVLAWAAFRIAQALAPCWLFRSMRWSGARRRTGSGRSSSTPCRCAGAGAAQACRCPACCPAATGWLSACQCTP